jgi:hypothetical protein
MKSVAACLVASLLNTDASWALNLPTRTVEKSVGWHESTYRQARPRFSTSLLATAPETNSDGSPRVPKVSLNQPETFHAPKMMILEDLEGEIDEVLQAAQQSILEQPDDTEVLQGDLVTLESLEDEIENILKAAQLLVSEESVDRDGYKEIRNPNAAEVVVLPLKTTDRRRGMIIHPIKPVAFAPSALRRYFRKYEPSSTALGVSADPVDFLPREFDIDDLTGEIEAALEAAEIVLNQADKVKKKRLTTAADKVLTSDYMLEAIQRDIEATLRSADGILAEPDGTNFSAEGAAVKIQLSEQSMISGQAEALLRERQAKVATLKSRLSREERLIRQKGKLATAISVALDGFALGSVIGVAAFYEYPLTIGDKAPVVVPALILGGVLGVESVVVATSGLWYGFVVQSLLGGGSRYFGRLLSKTAETLYQLPGNVANATASAAARTASEIGTAAKKKSSDAVMTVVKKKAGYYEAREQQRLAEEMFRQLKEEVRGDQSTVNSYEDGSMSSPDTPDDLGDAALRVLSSEVGVRRAFGPMAKNNLSSDEGVDPVRSALETAKAQILALDTKSGFNGVTSDSPARSFRNNRVPLPGRRPLPLNDDEVAVRSLSPRFSLINEKPRPLIVMNKKVSPVNATKKSPRKHERSPTLTLRKSKRLKSPSGIPTLRNWRISNDGALKGYVQGSDLYKDGIEITTSPLAEGENAEGGFVIKTVTGSR